jgi:hypothetical protein
MKNWRAWLAAAGVAAMVMGCGGNRAVSGDAPASGASAADAQRAAAPPAASTGGFDGQRAYQHVVDLVGMGPRTAGTEGGQRAQAYILEKLRGFGCTVEEQAFSSPTPIGTVAMKNLIVKIPGAGPDIVMYATHYDTKRETEFTFVGADDGGSSTGVMLELARHLCQRRSELTVWIVFFDGEEAFREWSSTDSLYGSRELAARMALTGDLRRVRAMILADLVGGHDLLLKRESESTDWLVEMIWSTAGRLGYGDVFVDSGTSAEDDHLPFLRRGVPAADIIDLDGPMRTYWHTADDTLDKVSARSLAIVGHVLLEALPALEQRSAR